MMMINKKSMINEIKPLHNNIYNLLVLLIIIGTIKLSKLS
jgi:hypothetical protein